jgi:SAM-dependent methyltransferase
VAPLDGIRLSLAGPAALERAIARFGCRGKRLVGIDRASTVSSDHHWRVVTVANRRGWARSSLDRLSEGVCRRAFSSSEAFLYEATIAASLSRVVLRALRPHLLGHRVLDVGAGGGRLAVALADSHWVAGIDPSWSQVRRFRRRAGGVAVTLQADGQVLPFADHAFDTVYSSCVFKHWLTPRAAMRECARVARPHGRLIIVEIDGAASPDEFRYFADRSRIPLGLRSGYVRFAMRTVVGVAPTARDLEVAFDDLAVHELLVERIPEMPFLIATATTA